MQEEMLRAVMASMFMIVMALTALMLYIRIYCMARIYNWNGKRFCYLGRAPLRKEGEDFAIRIGERMVDLSYTTLYRVCPCRSFCMRNRYRDVFVYADGGRQHLVVDNEPMKAEIL
ncbi:MAG: hypothetical protein HDR29_03230 [Lachnospiraceae bacterium]|nr:hypothetical protein [Lachnospiraceae bacterium]